MDDSLSKTESQGVSESQPISRSEGHPLEPPKSILIVDDHPMMRMGAAACFSEAPDCRVAGETDNAEEALALALRLRPDVVLLDIRLKGELSGIDVARSLRKQLPDTKIIVLTNFPHEPYVRAMMELGVDGYLLKDTPPRDVLDAVRMVMKGRHVFSATISSRIVRGYLDSQDSGERHDGPSLTSREAEVLQLVADGRTNDEIAEVLNLSVKAIQAHLTRLYEKLGARNRTEAVVYAARRGLVVLDHPH